jgi:hypothetical protein
VSVGFAGCQVTVDPCQRTGESRHDRQRWPLVFPLRDTTNVHFCTFVRNDSQPRA